VSDDPGADRAGEAGDSEQTGEPGASSFEYFRAIERAFIRLRGAPLLLSPTDWKVAQEWREQGVPLELVLETLEQVFARRELKEDEAEARVNSLRYCAPAVAKAWARVRENVEPARRAVANEIRVRPRLLALVESLPEEWPPKERLSAELLALGGDARVVEAHLAVLDARMLQIAEAGLEEGAVAEVESAVAERMARVGARAGQASSAEATVRVRTRVLRERLSLPVLSLFSPEAEAADRG
jgi:hypothetical protein